MYVLLKQMKVMAQSKNILHILQILEKEIKKLEEAPIKKDVTVLTDLASMDWQTMYKALNDEQNLEKNKLIM